LPALSGTDMFFSTQFPSTIFETGANARLQFGALPNGSHLMVSGASIIGDTATYTTGGITALAGDGSATGPGSVTFTLNNIPNATTGAGRIDFTTVTAPSTPASGKLSCFGDSTAKDWTCKNDAGTLTHGMQSLTATSHLFLTGSNADGTYTSAQPVEGDVVNLTTDLAGKQATGNYITATTGDVVATGPGSVAATIQANVVTNGDIRQSGALSLVGRSANSTGNVADISATAASGCAYRESGSTLGCGTLATAAYAASSVTYAKIQNETNGTFLGNFTGGAAAPSEYTLGTNLSVTGGVLNATGGSSLTAGTGITFVGGTAVTSNLATGISGGQSAIGDTASGGNLTLSSTSNATKGKIVFGSTSNAYYDEANGQWIQGNSSPISGLAFQVLKNQNSETDFYVGNSSTGTGAIVALRAGLSTTSNTSAFAGVAMVGDNWGAGAGIPPGGGIFECSPDNGASCLISQRGTGDWIFATTSGRTERGRMTNAGNFAWGTSALSTSATNGFFYLESMAGAPSGTPTSINSGASIPVVYDSTHGRLYVPSGASPKPIGQDTTGFGTGMLFNTTGTGVWTTATNAQAAAAIIWPASTDVLISGGTSSAPVGDSNFTYNTTTHTLTSAGENDLGFISVNGVSMPTNAMFVAGHTTNADRDRAQFFVGGGALQATGASDNTFVDINAASSSVTLGTGVAGGIYATERIRVAPFTGGGLGSSVTRGASLYIDGAPTFVVQAGATWGAYIAGGGMHVGGRLESTATVSAVGLGITGSGGNMLLADSAAQTLGFFLGTSPVGQQTVSGSRGGNAALASLLTALASYGLIVDSTTP
jgi:hypothetical protein